MADFRMPTINRTVLAGRLTRDPEVRYIASGTRICSISLAVSRKYKTKEGVQREDTLFINGSIWGEMGKWPGENLFKGDPVYVEGSLVTEEWTDKTTQQKRSMTKMNIQNIQSLVWQERGEKFSGGQQEGQRQERPTDEAIPEDDIPF